MEMLKVYLTLLSVTTAYSAAPRLESAIFTCGYALFRPEEIPLLFPPSDISRNEIDDATTAEMVHRRSIDSFCRHFTTYTSCVKDNLFYLPQDDAVKMYMDVDNFHKIFKFFCRNKSLISEQFQCTRLSVWGRSCPYGGVYGIITQVSEMIQSPVTKDEFCTNVRDSIECRVTNQLASCHGKYADVMERIYHSLVGKYCPSQISLVL
ncbi:hypothetical protein ACF0H5_003474 [Mactra antiquata]